MANQVDYEIEIMQYKHTLVNGANNVAPLSIKGWLPEEVRMDATSTWEAPFSGGIMGMLPGAVVAGLQAFGVKPASQMLTVQVWQATESQDMTFQLAFYTENDPKKDVRDKVLSLMSLVIPSVDENGFLLSPGPSLDPEKGRELVDALGKVVEGQLTGTFKAFKGFAARMLDFAESQASGTNAAKSTTLDSNKVTTQKSYAVNAKSAIANREALAQAVQNRISIRFGKFLMLRDAVVISANPTWSTSNLDAVTGLPNHATVDIVVRPLFALTAQDLQEMFFVLSEEDLQDAFRMGREPGRISSLVSSITSDEAAKESLRAGQLASGIN